MSYSVRLTKTVADKVTNLHPEIKKQLRAAVNEVAEKPYSGKELQEELSGYLSYRFNRYRIIYQVSEDAKTITVVMFGHRRDVYELFGELVNTRKGGQ
ncbi:MAG: type II toxin-antitoxin system RelE/ParE family toxin [Desulfurivibrionaceae bacterium]